MRRREFISLLGSGAASWPLHVRAQPRDRMRTIGALHGQAESVAEGQLRIAAFQQALQQLGWEVGQNIRIEHRFGAGRLDAIRRYAAELVALSPELIFTSGSSAVGPLLELTRTIPLVFVIVPDPVGAGYVSRLSRPGGNATGFMQVEYNLSGKWLELLKQIAPAVTRAAVLRDPGITAGIGQFAVIQSVSSSVGVEVSPISLREPAGEIERNVAAFAQPGHGLVVTAGPLSAFHRDLIIGAAARHKLPAVYFERNFVEAGGLISYGADFVDQYRRAAGYVDRILKGEKPSDLPVQAPTRYDMVINLKTAKALGLTVPASILARADAVIE